MQKPVLRSLLKSQIDSCTIDNFNSTKPYILCIINALLQEKSRGRMPKPNPNTNDARSMFLTVYGDTRNSNSDKINQMSELNKQINKEKREQNELFNLILARLAKEQLIKEQLLSMVQTEGYTDLPSALNLMRNQYGQSPLVHAFQQQNLVLRNYLSIWAPS